MKIVITISLRMKPKVSNKSIKLRQKKVAALFKNIRFYSAEDRDKAINSVVKGNLTLMQIADLVLPILEHQQAHSGSTIELDGEGNNLSKRVRIPGVY